MYENFNIFIKDGRGTRWRGGGLVESTPLTGTIAKYDLLLHTIKKKTNSGWVQYRTKFCLWIGTEFSSTISPKSWSLSNNGSVNWVMTLPKIFFLQIPDWRRNLLHRRKKPIARLFQLKCQLVFDIKKGNLNKFNSYKYKKMALIEH